MASDKRKDKPSNILDDEFAWDDAIDEWDKAFSVPEEPKASGAGAPAKASAGQHKTASPDDRDPLVDFISGDMELPEEPGRALGSLLGSSFEEESPTVVKTAGGKPSAAESPEDLGISPEGVEPDDSEPEMVTVERGESTPYWDHAPTPVAFAHDVLKEEEQQREELGESAEPTEPGAAAAAEVERPSSGPLQPTPTPGVDLESLLQGMEIDVPPPAEAAARAPGAEKIAEARRRVAAAVAVRTKPQPEKPEKRAAPVATAPKARDLFDEVVGTLPEEPEPGPEDQIEAGEVLPRPAEIAAPVGELQAYEELPEPEEEQLAEPPGIPEPLLELDLAGISKPGRGRPVDLDPEYWTRLSERLELESGLTDSSGRASALEYLVARAFEELEEPDQAIDHYREVLNHRPGHLAAMRELRRLHATRREVDQLAELLGEMAQRVSGEEKRALLAARAEFLWTRNGDDPGARSVVEQMTDTAPSDLRALLIRADLAAAARDDEELSSTLDLIAGAVHDPSMESAIRLEIGRMEEVRGSAQAAAAAYQKAATADAECAAAREALIRVAAGQRDASALALALGASGVRTGLWGARRLRRRAKLIQHHGLSGHDALAMLDEARALAPLDPLIVEDLAEARSLAGDASRAQETYLELSQLYTDPEERALALREAAFVTDGALQDRVRALELLTQAAALLPDNRALRAEAEQAALADPDASRRVEALRSAAQMAKGSARAARHLAAATILEHELQQPPEAAVELIACLEHEPSCRLALTRLEQIYRRSGSVDRLCAALDTAAEATDDPQDAAELRERAAFLYESTLAQPETALTRYREILQSGPDCQNARWGVLRTLAALRRHKELADELAIDPAAAGAGLCAARIWTQSGDALWSAGQPDEAEACYRNAVTKSPDYLPAAWSIALALGRGKRWGELNELWTRMAEGLPRETPEPQALLMRVASLIEHGLRDPSEAARLYQEVASQAGAAPGAAQSLVRVLRATRSHDQLAESLERDLKECHDPVRRLTLLMALGSLARRSGAEWRVAESSFRRALEESPGNPLVRQELLHLYASNQSWQSLADLLLADLREAGAIAPLVQAYRSLAELDLRRGDEASARLNYESIIELEPSSLPALRFLQRHILAGAGGAELHGALRREAESAAQPSDAAALWLELGRLLAHEPPKPEEEGTSPGVSALALASRGLTARLAFLAVIERDPSSIFALHCLADQAWANKAQADLGALYRQLAGVARSETDRSIYLARAAELTDGAEQTDLFREALESLPRHLGAIYGLRDLSLRSQDWKNAVLALEAEGDASRVQEHITSALLVAGEICRRHLSDLPRARRAFEAVLEAEPSDVLAFTQLRQQAEAAGEWADLATLLARRTEVERSSSKRIELHRSLAAVYRERLGNRDEAKEQLRQLLTLTPEDGEALSSLADLASEDADWTEAADALIRLARLEKNPIALRDIFLRLGCIYQDQAPDPKRAIASFNKVITLDPSHLDALQRLGDLYLKNQDFKRALSTTVQLLERESSSARRVDHQLRIARIYEDGLKDSHQAAIAYRQALDHAPADLKAIGELCGFFARQSDQRSLMVHLDRSVATMRARLKHDAFEPFAYQALFKIFGWRKAPDGCLCAGQALEALGEAGPTEQEFVDSHSGGVGSPGKSLGEPEHDEWLFHRSIPGGFRQVFQLLSDAFARIWPGDLKARGVGRSDRVTDSEHPLRRVGDPLARDFGVSAYDLYLSKNNPTLLIVENTDPPAILVGSALLEEITEEEIRFLMGRCLWTIRKAMILPSRLRPEDLEILVAAVVRQYTPEFQPVEVDAKLLQEQTKQVARALPRKLKQELMPFAIECSGPEVDLRSLGAAVVHSANRAGLLAARSIHAGLAVLRKASGKQLAGRTKLHRVTALRGNDEAEELLKFAVSDAHFELRRGMHIAVRG